MILINDPKDCCGCTACASICAHDAITMNPDALGFLYPKVDTSKCTGCGLCEKVCSFNANYDRTQNLPSPEAYGARHKNAEEVETSRSGASFIAISDWILAHGGVVYGAGYTNHLRVVHKRATNKEERDEFKGSKYVQSDMTNVFRQVKKDLTDGRVVLFSGTPCQTAGLNSYIGRKFRDNLYLLDIVCHGVPGPYLWEDYISYLEKKQGDKIAWVNFRDKQKFGWNAHHESFRFLNTKGTVSFPFTFYKINMFRHSCGNCHFCNVKRPSDLTIADFWGWDKTDPTCNADGKGINLILINTEKGKNLFEDIKQNMYIYPAELENVLQPNLQKPSDIHPLRMQFEQEYTQKGFLYVMRKYGDFGLKYQLCYKYRAFKKIVKRIVKII